jgi:serine/threonine-protein kinase RsbW
MQRTFHTAGLARAENLGSFRDFVEAASDECGLHPDDLFALRLAMDEACSNIIEHGYAGLETGSITLELEIDAGLAVLRITDFGHPFEPKAGPPPDLDAPLEERPIGGLGLFLIYSTMDSVDYNSGPGGNTLILTRKLAPRG